MKFPRRIAAAFLSTTLLAGCGSPSSQPRYIAPISDGEQLVGSVSALRATSGNRLYVANGGSNTVTLYAKSKTHPLRTVSEGIDDPQAIALAKSGELFVANIKANNVTVYGNRGGILQKTISQGMQNPSALAFDPSGNLYVANTYANEVAFQGTGNSVTVYAPGSTSVLRTVTQGIQTPVALGFDDAGDLYVANRGNSTVTEYAPGSTSVSRTIFRGINDPAAVALGP